MWCEGRRCTPGRWLRHDESSTDSKVACRGPAWAMLICANDDGRCGVWLGSVHVDATWWSGDWVAFEVCGAVRCGDWV
jgi:hypothetical protein